MSNFNEILKDMLQDNNLTVKELAKLTKIQDSLLYKYVNNKTEPTIKNLIKLADYFNCSIDYLIGLSEHEKFVMQKGVKTIKFYEVYTNLLKEHSLSHYSLCKILGYSMSSLTLWKNGQIPYLDTLIKIAKYFDVSIDYLVGISEEK